MQQCFIFHLPVEAMISIISAAKRRPKAFTVFLALIFTYTGYWFGRRSCDYTIVKSGLYASKGKLYYVAFIYNDIVNKMRVNE